MLLFGWFFTPTSWKLLLCLFWWMHESGLLCQSAKSPCFLVLDIWPVQFEICLICWDSSLTFFRPSLQKFFALFLHCSQYTIGHLVKHWLSLCFTIFLDFHIHLISRLSSQEISKQLKSLFSTLVPSMCCICQANNTLSCSVQHSVGIQNSENL